MSKSKLFGLIGRPLAHSFSQAYFTKKFEDEGLDDHRYDSFPIYTDYYLNILKRDNDNLVGLNVTIPYKESVMHFMDGLDETALEIGAVNTIDIRDGRMIGYNTDAIGFQKSFEKFVEEKTLKVTGALILGTGGASKAVKYVLDRKNIPFKMISRSKNNGALGYDDIDEKLITQYNFIVNTTPVGTFPKAELFPKIPYHLLTAKQSLFDLVYNPEKTVFLAKGEAQGCSTRNGLDMLHAQAEAAWEIWNK